MKYNSIYKNSEILYKGCILHSRYIPFEKFQELSERPEKAKFFLNKITLKLERFGIIDLDMAVSWFNEWIKNNNLKFESIWTAIIENKTSEVSYHGFETIEIDLGIYFSSADDIKKVESKIVLLKLAEK